MVTSYAHAKFQISMISLVSSGETVVNLMRKDPKKDPMKLKSSESSI